MPRARRRAKPARRTRQGFAIRPATLRDLNSLMRQRRSMWEAMGIRDRRVLNKADPVYREWARKQLIAGNLHGWLAQDSTGKILAGGCLWLQPIQPFPGSKSKVQPYLMSMYTDPEAREKGLARQIVQEAMKWCKRNGYTWVSLHASTMGRRLYRSLGFKRTWQMRLDLTKTPSERR